jgi:hypothetical protein
MAPAPGGGSPALPQVAGAGRGNAKNFKCDKKTIDKLLFQVYKSQIVL